MHLSNLISSKQQKATESVIVVLVITEGTACGQVDGHLVCSIQLQDNKISGSILLVWGIYLFQTGHHVVVVYDQLGAGGQEGTSNPSVTVDGNSKGVDTSVESGEDTRVRVVATVQVKEDFSVDDDFVWSPGAIALKTCVLKSDREGSAAACRGRGKKRKYKK